MSLGVSQTLTKHRAVSIFKHNQSKKNLTTFEDVGGMIIRNISEHPATKRRICRELEIFVDTAVIASLSEVAATLLGVASQRLPLTTLTFRVS